MKLEIGNVLVRRGALAPFIIEKIWYLSADKESFEISERGVLDRWGNLSTCLRRVHSRNLSMYDFIAKEFMDDTYVAWATRERGGQFILKEPEPAPKPPEPEKPFNKQIDVVKAVFYRQNRILNPGITVEEVERLWSENYFPLYSQVSFELKGAFNKAGSLTPLNYEPPDPPTPAPDEYKATVTKARPFDVLVDEKAIPKPELKILENLLDMQGIKGEEKKSRIEYFKGLVRGIIERKCVDGDYLAGDGLKHVEGSNVPKSHILAIQKQGEDLLVILGDLSQHLIPTSKLPKSSVEPDFSQVEVLDSGHSVSFGNYDVACSEIILL